MTCIALTDCRRYEAMGIDLLFYDEDDGTRHWVFKPSCAYKFIVVHDVLLIGPIRTHVYLYIAMMTLGDSIEDAKATKVAMERQWHSGVTAAGEVDVNGEVTGWKSGGFRMETPEDQRSEIAATIRELYETGELIIQ